MEYKFDARASWVHIADSQADQIKAMLSASKVDLSGPGIPCSFHVVGKQVGEYNGSPIREYGFVETNSNTIIGFVQEGLRIRIATQWPGSDTSEIPASGEYDCTTAKWAQLWARWKYGGTEASKVIEAADAYVVGADDVVYLMQDSSSFQQYVDAARPAPTSSRGSYIPIVAGQALGGAFTGPQVPCGTTVVSGSDQGGGKLPGIVDVNALADKGMSGWTMAAIGAGVLAAGAAGWMIFRKK